MAEKEFKHIVRVINTDLDGNQDLIDSLRKIKGISFMMINAILNSTGIDPHLKTGYIDDNTVKKLEDAILHPNKYNIPSWLYNRRKDIKTGEDIHLIGTDLMLQHDFDLKRLKKIKSYRGIRHIHHLPVRGQRTRSNFRKNKGKPVSIKKKTLKK